jgi:hypothetical protein
VIVSRGGGRRPHRRSKSHDEHPPPPLAAVGAAAALALAAPAALAHAGTIQPQPRAGGEFVYYSFAGQHRLVNPASNWCITISGQPEAGPVSTLTDDEAIVFLLPDCTGPAFGISQGQTSTVPLPEYTSVIFAR